MLQQELNLDHGTVVCLVPNLYYLGIDTVPRPGKFHIWVQNSALKYLLADCWVVFCLSVVKNRIKAPSLKNVVQFFKQSPLKKQN